MEVSKVFLQGALACSRYRLHQDKDTVFTKNIELMN